MDFSRLAAQDLTVVPSPLLRTLTTFRIGGAAKALIVPKTEAALKRTLKRLQKEGIAPLVIGKGSNLLVSDDDLPVPLLQLGGALADIRIDGNSLRLGAGSLRICGVDYL